MKVVLFCGGLGTRIREYSESIPKPMVPVGHQPILWHVMQYYSQYGHHDFVLCLGYKANVIKEYLPELQADRQQRLHHLRVRQEGRDPGRPAAGLARHAGRYRHLAQYRRAPDGGRHLVKDEEMFLANYSDGLTDAPLPEMIDNSRRAARSPASSRSIRRSAFIWRSSTKRDRCSASASSQELDIWINGGYFIFRKEIFDFIKEGEELAGDQGHGAGAARLDDAVVDLAGQQPQRQADHPRAVPEHPLDGQVRLAGVGGPQHRLHDRRRAAGGTVAHRGKVGNYRGLGKGRIRSAAPHA